MANKNKIGEAYVEVTARDSTSAGFDSAKRGAEEYSRTAEQSLKSAGDAIDKQTEGVRKLSGAFTSVLGIAGAVAGAFISVFNAIQAVNEQLRSGSKIALEYAQSLGSTVGQDPTPVLNQVKAKVAELEAELGRFDENPIAAQILGRFRFQIEEELEAIRSLRDSLIGQQRGFESQRKRNEAAAEQLEIEREIEATYERASRKALETESEIGRIQIESSIEQDRVRERLAEVQDARLRAALENELRYIQEAADFKLEQIKKTEAERARIEDERRREREQKEAESAKRQADALAKAFEGALDRVEQRARAANGGIQSTLAGIQRTLAEINTKVARSGGSV